MDSVADTSVDLYRASGEKSVPAMIPGIMHDPKQEDRDEDQGDPRAEEGKLLTLPVFALTAEMCLFVFCLHFCWHEVENRTFLLASCPLSVSVSRIALFLFLRSPPLFFFI